MSTDEAIFFSTVKGVCFNIIDIVYRYCVIIVHFFNAVIEEAFIDYTFSFNKRRRRFSRESVHRYVLFSSSYLREHNKHLSGQTNALFGKKRQKKICVALDCMN